MWYYSGEIHKYYKLEINFDVMRFVNHSNTLDNFSYLMNLLFDVFVQHTNEFGCVYAFENNECYYSGKYGKTLFRCILLFLNALNIHGWNYTYITNIRYWTFDWINEKKFTTTEVVTALPDDWKQCANGFPGLADKLNKKIKMNWNQIKKRFYTPLNSSIGQQLNASSFEQELTDNNDKNDIKIDEISQLCVSDEDVLTPSIFGNKLTMDKPIGINNTNNNLNIVITNENDNIIGPFDSIGNDNENKKSIGNKKSIENDNVSVVSFENKNLDDVFNSLDSSFKEMDFLLDLVDELKDKH